nr:hypothetical protein BgiMline_013784 [Biomphalaria glabrata]
MSVMDYHREVCPDRCDNGTKVLGRDLGEFSHLNIECFDCECKRPACEIYGICCDDISESPSTWTQPKESPSLYCDDKSMYYFPILCIRSCPKDYRGNNEVKRLCQEDVNLSETTMDTFLRVIDTENQVVYYNIYCAMCNNIGKPTQLVLDARCSSFSLVYKAETPNELLRLLLLNGPECQVLQKSDWNFNPFECYRNQTFTYGSSGECDRDDPRKLKDPQIVQACHELAGDKYQIYTYYGGKYYKNIFCYICGTMSYPFIVPPENCKGDFIDDDLGLYRMLVNLQDSLQERETVWRGKKLLCGDVELLCGDGELLCGDVELLCGDGELLCGDGELLCGDGELLCGDVELLCGDVELLCGDVELLCGDGELLCGDGELLCGDGELLCGDGELLCGEAKNCCVETGN